MHGCGFTGSGEKDQIKAKVRLRKTACGDVEILVASVEMGQGAHTTLRKIVARSLGVDIGKVIYRNPDTDRVPDSGPTVASRTVMIVGALLEKAALELKQRWGEGTEADVVMDYAQPEYLEWDQDTFKGDAYPAFSWGVNVVEVEIDPITFETTVVGVWAAYDLGTPIDEQIVRGQIEGGIIQGLGYASMEVMQTRQGRIQQGTMTDYTVPTSLDFPNIECRLIDNPYPEGPAGAKGAGELPLVGAAPAYTAAIQNALGIPIKRIPATPEHLVEINKSGQNN